MGSSQSQQQNGAVYGGVSRGTGNIIQTAAGPQKTLEGIGRGASDRGIPGVGNFGPNIQSPIQPATVPQYAVGFFQQLAVYAYFILYLIIGIAFVFVVIGQVSERCGSGINKFVLVYLYDFVQNQLKASYRVVTMIKPGKNKLMFYGLRVFASFVYAWWCLVVGALDTVRRILTNAGILVPVFLFWLVWTFATYQYPFALGVADSVAVGAENVTNVSFWIWGTLIHLVNSISPYTNQLIFTGVRFLQITIYDGVFVLLGGTDDNPLFQDGSIFSAASDMIALQTTFGRRLQQSPNEDKLFGFIETFARFFAQIQALWDFVILVIYNLLVLVAVTVLQTALGVIFAVINVFLCSIQVLPCAILQVVQYLVDGFVFIFNEALKGIVYLVTFGAVSVGDTIGPQSIACSGGILASVPCSCASFFTSMDECGSFKLQCREKNGVYYEYKVYPNQKEVLLNQGSDKSIVCPNQRRVLSDYHGFIEEELGYVACVDVHISNGYENATIKKCPGYAYGEPHHQRVLMSLDIHVPLSSPTVPPETTAPPTVEWLDRVQSSAKTHLAEMNRKSGLQCTELSVLTDPACYLHLAMYMGKSHVNERVNSILDSGVRAKVVTSHGRKLQQETRMNQLFYALHQMRATAEMRWIEYQETGANPFRELHPKAVDRIRRRLQESDTAIEVPKLWAYDRTKKGLEGLFAHVTNFPTRRKLLIATQSPTYPKYGAWTGVQCPDNEYLCPSNVCLPNKKQCPQPPTGSWLQWLEYWMLQAEIYVSDVKPNQVVSGLLNCYNNYAKQKETNPFLIDHYQTTDPEINKYFVYCWPLVDYIDPNVYVPAYVSGWSAKALTQSQCTDGQCQCNGYWFSLFETDFQFVEGVPYFSVANLYDGALALWTLICQLLFAPGRVLDFLTNNPWQMVLRPFYNWGWVSVGAYYFWWDQGQGNFVDGVYVPATLNSILTCAFYNLGNIGFLIVFVVLFECILLGLGRGALYAIWALIVNIVVLPLSSFQNDDQPPDFAITAPPPAASVERVDVEEGSRRRR